MPAKVEIGRLGLASEFRSRVLPFAFGLAVEKVAPLVRVLPPIHLKEVDQEIISVAHAWEVDRAGGGENAWVLAAREFFTVYGWSPDRETRMEAAIGLVQMLINCGRFDQAKRWLGQASFEVIPQFLPQEKDSKYYFLARIHEKLAWIADYEGNFRGAIGELEKARGFLEQIPEENRDERGEELLSTITHFSGRAHLGCAHQGVDREENIEKAIGFFEQDLERYEGLNEALRPRGKPRADVRVIIVFGWGFVIWN